MQHTAEISSDLKNFLSMEEREQLAGYCDMREWAKGPSYGDRVRYAVLQLDNLQEPTQVLLRPRLRATIIALMTVAGAGLFVN